MHLHLRVPACTASIFQCGLIERTIPYAHLERADSLVKPSLLLFGLDTGGLGFRMHAFQFFFFNIS
jgi:hypothetical protein